MGFGVFAAVLLICCPGLLGQADLTVSLVRLIADPEKHDGQPVAVIGFLRLEFEGNMLYLHEEDYAHSIEENAVRLGINKKQREEFANNNMHYVFVAGTFRAAKRGTSNPNGTIVDIVKIEDWPAKHDPPKP